MSQYDNIVVNMLSYNNHDNLPPLNNNPPLIEKNKLWGYLLLLSI